MNVKFTAALAGLLMMITLMMAGCGNKGPLYLPEHDGDSVEAADASDDAEDRR